MTGGTPDVRSHKSLTLLTFDIWHLIIWAFEHVNMWTFEHLNIGTLEHLNIWTLGYWNIGTLEHRNIWTLEHWKIGTLENWNIGTSKHWNIWTFENSTFIQHQSASCDINCIDTVRLGGTLVTSIASKDWVIIWKSGRCCCGDMIAQRCFKSSCRS